MKRYSMVLALLAVLMMAALPAMAYGPRWSGKGQGPDGPRFERGQGWDGCPYYNYQDSTLTDGQKAQLQKIHDEFSKKSSSLRDQMRVKRAEVRLLMNSENPDEKKIRDTQKQINAIRDQLDEERIRHQLGIKKIVPDARFGPGPGKALHRGWGQGRCARI